MKRILICGLPGSGKSTLAKKLVEILGNADHYNADEIREKFSDWDFSLEGRQRQMKRMQDYSRKSVAKERYGVADFVCPTNELQEEFRADYTIFMDTIEESEYKDTNELFEKPSESGLGVTLVADEWWQEDKIDEWAKLIAVDIKDHEFQSKLPTAQMIGRFQPFHADHKESFEKELNKYGQVAVFVTDAPITEDSPHDVLDICRNLELELSEYAGKFRTYPVPNIINEEGN